MARRMPRERSSEYALRPESVVDSPQILSEVPSSDHGVGGGRTRCPAQRTKSGTVEESVVRLGVCRNIPKICNLPFVIKREEMHFVHVKGGSVRTTGGFMDVKNNMEFVGKYLGYVELLRAARGFECTDQRRGNGINTLVISAARTGSVEVEYRIGCQIPECCRQVKIGESLVCVAGLLDVGCSAI